MEASTYQEIPTIEWDQFLAEFRWRQGEHMTLVGPTGQGKTTLAMQLLPMRKYVIVFATKSKDPLINDLIKKGYQLRTNEWDGNHELGEKIVLKPPLPKGAKSLGAQAEVFQHALYVAFKQGGWTVYLDEARYITDTLKLADECELLWQQGRSLGVTMVAGAQRPVKIPLTAYDQATHLFFWRDNDETNLRRIGGLGGVSNRLIRETVSVLRWHEVLYLNTRTGEMVRTKVRK